MDTPACSHLNCDNYVSQDRSYMRYLWWNWWFLSPVNRRDGRFCESCRTKGNTQITLEEAKLRNGGS